MRQGRRCRILLTERKLNLIKAGEHAFYQGLISVLKRAEYQIEFNRNTFVSRKLALLMPGICFIDEGMETARRGFIVRRSYKRKFFRIEKSQHRKDWGTTNVIFDATKVGASAAETFYEKQVRKLNIQKPDLPVQGSYIFVPLQSEITKKRSFQSCSPVDMIWKVLENDKERQLVITLHPAVDYSKKELKAVGELVENPRITLSTAPMNDILAGSDYVVTENSSVALHGILYKKPAILFAICDFHHIFQYVPKVGVEFAFQNVLRDEPDFIKFYYWFFMLQMIPQFSPNLESRISDRLQQLGIEL